MRHTYIFNAEDASYWVGGIYGSVKEIAYNGFEIEVSANDEVDISTLDAFGDYAEMNQKCKTLEALKQYLQEHLIECRDYEDYMLTTLNDEENIQELIEILEEQISTQKI